MKQTRIVLAFGFLCIVACGGPANHAERVKSPQSPLALPPADRVAPPNAVALVRLNGDELRTSRYFDLIQELLTASKLLGDETGDAVGALSRFTTVTASMVESEGDGLRFGHASLLGDLDTAAVEATVAQSAGVATADIRDGATARGNPLRLIGEYQLSEVAAETRVVARDAPVDTLFDPKQGMAFWNSEAVGAAREQLNVGNHNSDGAVVVLAKGAPATQQILRRAGILPDATSDIVWGAARLDLAQGVDLFVMLRTSDSAAATRIADHISSRVREASRSMAARIAGLSSLGDTIRAEAREAGVEVRVRVDAQKVDSLLARLKPLLLLSLRSST